VLVLLTLIVGFSVLGSVGSVALAGLFLLFPQSTRSVLVPSLLSYATGTLLGASFLGILPRVLNSISASLALNAVLVGIVLFFVLEKFALWRHCHDSGCEVHSQAGFLLLIGDAFHNFVDGAAIASTFVISIPLGVVTSLAVIAHEIPQEVGDFAILLQSGYSKREAFFYNTLSGLCTLPGALLTYWFVAEVEPVIPYIMALSAASFIYIAIADLVPSLHRYVEFKSSINQLVCLLAGIGTIALVRLSHKGLAAFLS
jgi:zinc and cadmium transporter